MADANGIIERCEWCLTFSGRTKKGRPCCELRALAAMPRTARENVYMDTHIEHGVDAKRALQEQVKAEYRRKLDYEMQKDKAKKAGSNTGNSSGHLFV